MKKKRLDLPSYTYFISCVDTSVSESIVDLVKNDFTGDSPPHTILGTTTIPNSDAKVPSAVRKIINNEDLSVLTETIKKSDVIIYDLNSSSHNEIEYAIKLLKMTEYEGDKVFILISNVLAWSNTPLKEKKEDEDEDEEDLPEDDDEGEAEEEEEEEE